MKPIEEMSTQELYALKKERYEAARRDGTLQKIRLVGTEFGRDINARYGPKYILDVEDVRLYVDTYGGYMTVQRKDNDGYADERRVAGLLSTHPTEEFIKPGEWQDRILALYPEAQAKKAARDERIEEERRRRALDQIV